MPRMVQMTWVASEHRWKKMYRGVRYIVSCRELGTEPTQAASLLAANQWWERKLAELTGRHARPVIDTEKIVADMNTHARNMEFLHLACMSPEVADQVQSIRSLVAVVPHERTAGALVDAWVQTEQGRVASGKVGLSRANMNRVCLHHFLDWIGAATPAAAITGPKWLEWYNHLAGRVAGGLWSVAHADRIFGVSKRFVLFLYEMEIIDRPRNLDNRNLTFSVSPTTIVTWAAEEIHQLLAVTTGQTRLHVLLMLNCGFVGKDISDLRQDEVDWTAGVIARKRSKTRKEKDVPTVRYKLWDRTFALLKEYRGADSETVLLTTSGKKWIEEHHDGEYHRSDKVGSNFKYWMNRAKVKKPPKALRATAASMLAEHPQFKFYAQYFLGQSPRTIADKHHVKPNDREFFKALAWLEGALGFK